MNYAVLWSHSQQAFHVESVDDMLDANIVALAQDRSIEYAPIYIGSESDCRAAVIKFIQKL